jgi:hypothetical protein
MVSLMSPSAMASRAAQYSAVRKGGLREEAAAIPTT